jgi:DNA ligase-1
MAGLEADDVEEVWHGLAPPYQSLFAWIDGAGPRPDPRDAPVFRPLMLANPLEAADFAALDPAMLRAEWKWDGIRVQIAATTGGRVLYSRGAEDISAAFPEMIGAIDFQAVVDGELLVVRDGVVAPFSDVQQRLNRKSTTAKMQRDYPVLVRLYDILFDGTEDLRPLPFDQRRARLEAWFARIKPSRMDLSAPIRFDSLDELARLRDSLQSRLALTLACLRSVPVLAETSVIIAAATGVPVRRIFVATLLPNFAVALIYSLAADDSFMTASVTFLATLAASFVLWRWLGKKPQSN